MSASTSARSPGPSGGRVGPEYTGSPTPLISTASIFFFVFDDFWGSLSLCFDGGMPTWMTGKERLKNVESCLL